MRKLTWTDIAFTKQTVKDRYFPVPNLLFALDLTAPEIALYCYLMFRENRKTYQCYPSYRTIGRDLHMTKNTVKKYVERLEDKQLIYTEHTKVKTKRGEVRNGTLLYTILPIKQAYDYYNRKRYEECVREYEIIRVQAKLKERGMASAPEDGHQGAR